MIENLIKLFLEILDNIIKETDRASFISQKYGMINNLLVQMYQYIETGNEAELIVQIKSNQEELEQIAGALKSYIEGLDMDFNYLDYPDDPEDEKLIELKRIKKSLNHIMENSEQDLRSELSRALAKLDF